MQSRLEEYYISKKGVAYITDAKRGMATDVNPKICQPLTAKGVQNWTGSFISPNIDHLEKSKTIGGAKPTKIIMKKGAEMEELRIRKITPREAWRLMSFSDEDFEKAEKVNSKTQLYKQAGNSIVEEVLKHIFREMIPKECRNESV